MGSRKAILPNRPQYLEQNAALTAILKFEISLLHKVPNGLNTRQVARLGFVLHFLLFAASRRLNQSSIAPAGFGIGRTNRTQRSDFN